MLHTDETTPEETTNDEFEKAEELKNNPPEVKATINDEEEMELLADLRKTTDKDGTVKSANSNTNDVNNTGTNTNVSNASKTVIQYQNHELIAKLSIAALNVGMSLILQFIADDFSEEAEKRYKLSETSKKELIEPLSLVLQQSKSKYNPVVILVITVIVSYVPMFIGAFRARKANVKAAKEKKAYLKNAGEEIVDEDDKKKVLQKEMSDLGKTVTEQKEKVAVVFKMTAGQQKRLKEIKSKKGRRSASDLQFLKEMNLDGLV